VIIFTKRNPNNIPSGEIKKFHSLAYVYKVEEKEVKLRVYQATTLPSHTERYRTVAPGLNKARLGQHPMNPREGQTPYPALNLYTVDGSRILPAVGGKKTSGINIHKPGINDYLGLHRGQAMSMGCLLIRRGTEDRLYNHFLSNFGVIIRREGSYWPADIRTLSRIHRRGYAEYSYPLEALKEAKGWRKYAEEGY